MFTNTGIEDAAAVPPPPVLVASASLPTTSSSQVTPEHQRTTSNAFAFLVVPPGDEDFYDSLNNTIATKIATKIATNNEKHETEKRLLAYTIQDFREEIGEKEQALLMKEGEIGDLKRRNIKDRNDHLKNEEDTEGEIGELEQKVGGLRDELNGAETKHTKLAQETTTYKEDTEARLTAMQQDIDQSKGELEEKEEKIGELHEKFVAANVKTQTNLDGWNAADAKYKLLEQDVVKEKDISQQNHDELLQQVSELKVELGFVKEDESKAIREKDIAINDRRTDNAKLSGQLSVAENKVEKLLGEITTVRTDKEGLASEKEQLQGKLEATVATHKNELALKDEIFTKVGAEKVELTLAKEELEDKLKAEKESHATIVASLENERTENGEEVTRLQAVVAQFQLEKAQLKREKETLVVVKEEIQEAANLTSQEQHARQRKKDATATRHLIKHIHKNNSTVHAVESDIEDDDDDDDDYDELLDGPWNPNWDHPGDVYDVDGKLTRKVRRWGPKNRYPPKADKCKTCKKGRGCRGGTFAECGTVKYECAGGCGSLIRREDDFWKHVQGNASQKGCVPYARKFSKHIAACEVKGGFQTFRHKKNEKDVQEDSVQEWLDTY